MSHHAMTSWTRRTSPAFCLLDGLFGAFPGRRPERGRTGRTSFAMCPARPAEISVDSTFPGYGTAVPFDGKWIEKGKEITEEPGHRDRPRATTAHLGFRGHGGRSTGIRIDWAPPGQA